MYEPLSWVFLVVNSGKYVQKRPLENVHSHLNAFKKSIDRLIGKSRILVALKILGVAKFEWIKYKLIAAKVK